MNVGDRQAGRERGPNVIDVPADAAAGRRRAPPRARPGVPRAGLAAARRDARRRSCRGTRIARYHRRMATAEPAAQAADPRAGVTAAAARRSSAAASTRASSPRPPRRTRAWRLAGLADRDPRPATPGSTCATPRRRRGLPRAWIDRPDGDRGWSSGSAAAPTRGATSRPSRPSGHGARWADDRPRRPPGSRRSATLGRGAVVLAGAVVNAGARVGSHAIVNSRRGRRARRPDRRVRHLAPGAVVGGGDAIGADATIGLGAAVRDHIAVGDGRDRRAWAPWSSPTSPARRVGVPASRPAPQSAPRDGQPLDALPRPASTARSATRCTRSTGAPAGSRSRSTPTAGWSGVATDGDLRRALLARRDAGRPARGRRSTRDFVAVRRRAQARGGRPRPDARPAGSAPIPVVDADGRPVGAPPARTSSCARVARANWAVIMAGGQGTRLRPLTETVPKPMLARRRPADPRAHRAAPRRASGSSASSISVDYLAEVIEDHFGDGAAFGVPDRLPARGRAARHGRRAGPAAGAADRAAAA